MPKHRPGPPTRKRFRDGVGRALLHGAAHRARKRGVPFSITVADFVIPERCPCLGTVLHRGKGQAHDDSPSLDRIDPRLGYVPGNVWVISRRANTLKSNATPDEMIMVASAVARQMQAAPIGLGPKALVSRPMMPPPVIEPPPVPASIPEAAGAPTTAGQFRDLLASKNLTIDAAAAVAFKDRRMIFRYLSGALPIPLGVVALIEATERRATKRKPGYPGVWLADRPQTKHRRRPS